MADNTYNCAKDFIVLRGGCYLENGVKIPVPDPTSGLYINNLSGLIPENLASISNEDLETATKIVEDKVLFAVKEVEKRLKFAFSEQNINLNKEGCLIKPCKVKSTYKVSAAKDRGIRVSRAWLSSKRARIYVKSIKLKSANAGATVIKVIDESTGDILFSENYTIVGGTEVSIKIDKSFDPETILIVAENANISPYVYECAEKACCGSKVSSCGGRGSYGLSGRRISPAQYPSSNIGHVYNYGYRNPGPPSYGRGSSRKPALLLVQGYDGGVTTSDAFLGACLRLDCTDNGIVCEHLKRLDFSILYQTGALILEEWLSPNSRMNNIATYNRDWVNKKIPEWVEKSFQYFNAEISAIIKEVENDFCYYCDPELQYITALPS